MADNIGIKLDKLLAQLNMGRLRQQDEPTYQVIKQLIDVLRETNASVGSRSGSSSSVIQQTIQQFFLGGDGDGGGGDGDIIPGQRGADGAAGPIGPVGPEGPPFPAFIFLESDQPDDPLPIPGERGSKGDTGATGATGASLPYAIIQNEETFEESIQFLAPPIQQSSGGAWVYIGSSSPSGATNTDFANLSAYSEILVLIDDVSRSASVVSQLRVSSDNGSTFLSASGDYVQVTTAGVETNVTGIAMFTTAATAARTAYAIIHGFNVSGAPRISVAGSTTPLTVIANTSAFNAIRLTQGSGTHTGTVYVWGRP